MLEVICRDAISIPVPRNLLSCPTVHAQHLPHDDWPSWDQAERHEQRLDMLALVALSVLLRFRFLCHLRRRPFRCGP